MKKLLFISVFLAGRATSGLKEARSACSPGLIVDYEQNQDYIKLKCEPMGNHD